MVDTESRDLSLSDANSGCSCCSQGNASAESKANSTSPEGAVVSDFLVEGMTCSHCVSSVTEELAAIDGVADVNVDLIAGGTSLVRVASSAKLDTEQVRMAIEEAGYTLA